MPAHLSNLHHMIIDMGRERIITIAIMAGLFGGLVGEPITSLGCTRKGQCKDF
jgi:hypothetical protein